MEKYVHPSRKCSHHSSCSQCSTMKESLMQEVGDTKIKSRFVFVCFPSFPTFIIIKTSSHIYFLSLSISNSSMECWYTKLFDASIPCVTGVVLSCPWNPVDAEQWWPGGNLPVFMKVVVQPSMFPPDSIRNHHYQLTLFSPHPIYKGCF
jgi:hypothetical protein